MRQSHGKSTCNLLIPEKQPILGDLNEILPKVNTTDNEADNS